MQAAPDKHSRFTVLICRPEQAQAIVQPILEMSLLVMGMTHSTKRKDLQERAEALNEAKKKLAKLMEDKFSRPFWPERFSNFGVLTNPLMGGYFDLTFNETTPSKEGGVVGTYKIRLSATRESTLDKFAAFVHANNPQLGSGVHEMARQMITATGI